MVPVLAMLLACSSDAVPLGSVSDAQLAAGAPRIALTARALTDLMGRSEDGNVVLPVVDVESERVDAVKVWVAPPVPLPDPVALEVWLARLGDRFDSRAQTYRVVGHAGDGSVLDAAVEDAVQRHGLRCDKGAPILVFPEAP